MAMISTIKSTASTYKQAATSVSMLLTGTNSSAQKAAWIYLLSHRVVLGVVATIAQKQINHRDQTQISSCMRTGSLVVLFLRRDASVDDCSANKQPTPVD
jgi:hypothetical protein